MPSDGSKDRVYRHVNGYRFQPRLPEDVYKVWTGPLKGKATRFLIEGARKYLEENGHSALEQELLKRRENVLREERELQILEMKLAGMRGIHGATPPSPAAPAPPMNGNGRNDNGHGIPETIVKELRAFHRSQERGHVPRAERQKNLLAKCMELLNRNTDLRAWFPTPEALLSEFAKRIL